MRNFGEIPIRSPLAGPSMPEKKELPPVIENSEPKKENSLEKKKVFIEYIKQFDEAHKNKELTPEEKKKRKYKIYAGIALATLATGGYYTNKESIQEVEKSPIKSELISDKNLTPDAYLEEVRKKMNQEYAKEATTQEIKKESQIPKNIEIKKTEEKKEEIPSKERLQKAHNTTIEIQAISRNLLKNDNFFPKKIFSDDFLSAIQAQESGFDKSAQSHKGAVGSMQVMPETIKETLLYINKINTKISFQEKDLTKEYINDLIYLIKQNPDLGKAFGNLYLAEIFNNFEIGKKSLENNWITLGRKKILACYNWGIGKFTRNATNEENWPTETKNYIKNISDDIEIFKIINSQLGIDEHNKKIKIETNKNQKDALPLSLKTSPRMIKESIILELRKFKEDKNIDYSKININEVISYYLGEIKIKEKIEKNTLKKEALEKLIKDLNHRIFKNFVAEKGFIKQKEKSPV